MIDRKQLLFCTNCDQCFLDEVLLDIHCIIHHNGKTGSGSVHWYVCKTCCKLFNGCSNFSVHMQGVHKQLEIDIEDCTVRGLKDITFPCQMCDTVCVLSRYCIKHKVCDLPYKNVELCSNLKVSKSVEEGNQEVSTSVENKQELTSFEECDKEIAEDINKESSAEGRNRRSACEEEMIEDLNNESSAEGRNRRSTCEQEIKEDLNNESAEARYSRSVCDEHSSLYPNCHSCQKCDESFDNCKVLWVHMLIEHDDSDLVCNLCPPDSKVGVKYAHILLKHMKQKHALAMRITDVFIYLENKTKVMIDGSVRYKCNECPTTVRTFLGLRSHWDSHIRIKEKDLDESKAVKTAIKKKLSSELSVCSEHSSMYPNCHSCQKCDDSFEDCNNLWTHMLIEHEDGDLMCNFCRISDFNYSKFAPVLENHLLMLHSVQLDIPAVNELLRKRSKVLCKDGSVLYKCSSCKSKMFDSFEKLKDHLFSHSDEKYFVCETCGKSFKRNTHLLAHIRCMHKPDTIKEVDCPTCGKTFRGKSKLSKHMRIHNDVGKYVCDICGVRCKQVEGLNSHKYIHRNEKFICSYCGRIFRRPQQLRNHIQIHLIPKEEYEHICQYCNRKFLRSETLRNHIGVRHNTETPFKCSVCNENFKIKKELQRHWKTVGHKP